MGDANTKNYFQQPDANGDNKLVVGGSMESGGGNNLKKAYLTGVIPDISTAGSIFITVPFAGTLTKLNGVLGAAISGADAVVTSKKNGSAITGGGFTVANAGSAAGDKDSGTPSAGNVFAAGDTLEIITNGASTDTAPEYITAEFELA